MGYKIVVTSVNNNVIGIGPLADKCTFDFYANMLGLYSKSPMLNDNLIYFIPETTSGKDGCFKVSEVIAASFSEDVINVQVGKFYIAPLDTEHVLDLFEGNSESHHKIASIDLKTGKDIYISL